MAELDAATQRAEIMQVLASMPEHYARALEAKYGDGVSVEDIARELGLTSTAAQSLLARARQTFRERWQSKFQGSLSAPPL
jgi:DNA-directed RNA polymerase specialized sigma24 family protein